MTCAYCSKPLPPLPSGKRHRPASRQYCGPRCSKAAGLEEQKNRKKAAAVRKRYGGQYCYCDDCNGEEEHHKGILRIYQ